ncbi:class I SAM-dependent DNA methyltransferase [Lewinella cohaerens]|uniref:class I SAM-dependent DNA methyltransferase n=1 Tax=Lewinella cohaerens TaxID=70995 RepID=UPI000372CF4D|nr:class I SAM-dependent methyltransferase [Lewinella cohaerens]
MDKTEAAISIFNRHAEEYQSKYMDLAKYHDFLDLFCSLIPASPCLLDLACGPGNVTRYVLNQHPNAKILGIDLAPRMLDLARINNPTAAFQLIDCKKISELPQKYDGILCGFCLPYLSKKESKKLIKDAAELLNTDGIFYLSTMEGEDSKSGWVGPSSGGDEKLYMYYHQESHLVNALIDNGFHIHFTQRVSSPTPAGSPVVDLIIIAKKQ